MPDNAQDMGKGLIVMNNQVNHQLNNQAEMSILDSENTNCYEKGGNKNQLKKISKKVNENRKGKIIIRKITFNKLADSNERMKKLVLLLTGIY